MKNHICSILLLLLSSPTYGQHWSKRFDLQDGNETGMLINILNDGMLVSVFGLCNNNHDKCEGLMKFDWNGNLIWKRAIYDSLSTNHREAIVIIDNTIYLHVNYLGVPDKDYSILAFDTTGQYLYRHDYEVPNTIQNWARDLSATGDRFYSTYQYRDTLTNQRLGKLRAFDKAWNILWEQSFPTGFVYPQWCDAEPTPDGGVALAYTGCTGYKCTAVVEKYDADGNQEWATQFPEAFEDAAIVMLATTPDGGYAGAWNADTFSVFYAPSPPLLFKLDANGQFVWQKLYLSQPKRELGGLFAAENGDIIASGLDDDPFSGLDDEEEYAGAIMRLTPDGETRWERRIVDRSQGGDVRYFLGGAELPNGDLVFTGMIEDTLPDDPYIFNIWLVKVDSNGCFEPDCAYQQTLTATKMAPARAEALFAGFPTPFGERLSLASVIGYPLPLGDYLIALYDQQGRLLHAERFDPALVHTVETAAFPPGLYSAVVYRDRRVIQVVKTVKI